MKLIPFLVFFMACNPLIWHAAEDAVIGEIQVVEEIVNDLSGVQQQSRPIVTPIKKF